MHDNSKNFGLFGTYRWVLAGLVAVTHIGPTEMDYTGNYAVFGFFILSGYLMTLVLRNKYLLLPNGIKKYYLNRFLRIYPLYAIVLIISFFIVLFYEESTSKFVFGFFMPETIGQAVANITIIGLVSPLGYIQPGAFILPAWSLSIEIIFWLACPFIVRKPDLLFVWTVLSVLTAAIGLASYHNIHLRYYSPLASSMVFCLGVWLFHLKKYSLILPKILGISMVLLWGYWHLFAHTIYPDNTLTNGLFVALLLNACIVYYLSQVDRQRIPVLLLKLDTLLGHLSYPIFLVHMLAGFTLHASLGEFLPRNSYLLFFATFILSNMIGFLMYYGVDQKIQNIRRKVRSGS